MQIEAVHVPVFFYNLFCWGSGEVGRRGGGRGRVILGSISLAGSVGDLVFGPRDLHV